MIKKKGNLNIILIVQECYETDDSRLCFQADNYCTSNIDGVFGQSHRSYYDIRKPEGTVEPPQDYISLLNQADLQKAIGVNPMRFEECANGPVSCSSPY